MVRPIHLLCMAMLLMSFLIRTGTPAALAQSGRDSWAGTGSDPAGPDWTNNGSRHGHAQGPQTDGWGQSGGTDDGMVPPDPGMAPQWKPRSTYPKVVDGPLRGPPARPAPTGQRYHCDDPPGYFPYTTTCRAPWRPVSSLGLW
jgi:hypothetical protein